MFWLTIIKDFIKILRAGQTPQQIAGGFALGCILGLSPMLTLQGVIVWLIILILNVNLSAAFLALTLFSLVAFLLDPAFHALGYALLVNAESLHALWTWLYNAPVAPLTRLNNTVVVGSFISALVLSVPVYIGMKKFVLVYRKNVGSKIEKWRLYQILKKNVIVQWYMRLRDIGG